MIDLDQQEVRRITDIYGDATYIFNKDEFVKNYNELVNTFQNIYPNYRLCYSYKTNYTPAVCQCVKSLGGYAEVVSDMEYELALRIGYTPDKIVFNGPIKGKYLKSHLFSGGINNVDRIEEVHYIISLAKENPDLKIKTGIRVNFDVDAGYTSRFGIDINQLDYIIDLLHKANVSINGFHCHMSRARGIEPWKLRAKTMLGIVDKYKLNSLEYISLGSGMYGKMDPDLQCQFPSDVPDYSKYAEAVLSQFAVYFKNSINKPIVFTEPGTTIISKYVDFLAEIIGIKEIRGKQFILCNCSFHNLGETCQMKNLPIRIYHNRNEEVSIHHAEFVGYTCLEQDVLYRNYSGSISVGDKVLFGNVGGYSLVDKPPFIMPNYPMISIENGNIKEIKAKETFDNIFSSFAFGE